MELYKSLELDKEKDLVNVVKEEAEKPAKRSGLFKGNPQWRAILDNASVSIALARDQQGKRVYTSKIPEGQDENEIAQQAETLLHICNAFAKGISSGNANTKEIKIIGGDSQLIFCSVGGNFTFVRQTVKEVTSDMVSGGFNRDSKEQGKIQGQTISQYLVQDYTALTAD